MSEVSASTIKELREMTGAGMMDCKKALTETKGNMQEAIDWLRKKGLANAAKKSGRVAAEGLIAISTSGTKGAMVEFNSETDFVSLNDKFQALARYLADAALDHGHNVEELKASKLKTGAPVADAISELIGTIGENMNLRRSAMLEVKHGVVASYIHSAVAPGLGKIGVLVALESTGDKAQLETLGKQIAMHIAAAKPDALTIAEVDPAKLARERTVLKEQAIASGKAPEIAEKMVEGRVRKYYEEVVLLEQIYVMDNKSKISQVVADSAKTIGAPVQVNGFVHFKLGEGVEKQETDFAAEVAAAAGAA
jgi:elongation factor Ts